MSASEELLVCAIDCATGESVCRPMTGDELAQRELDLQAAASLPPIDSPPATPADLIAQAQALVAQLNAAQARLEQAVSAPAPAAAAE